MKGCRNHHTDSDQEDHIRPLDAIFGGHDACPLLHSHPSLTIKGAAGAEPASLFLRSGLFLLRSAVPERFGSHLASQPRFTKKRIAMTITASITAASTIFAKVMFSTSLAYGQFDSVGILALPSPGLNESQRFHFYTLVGKGSKLCSCCVYRICRQPGQRFLAGFENQQLPPGESS
jgi:hypothetical protein